MSKVHGKRYAYKFDFHGLMTACSQQQAQSQASGGVEDRMSGYTKYQHHHSELGPALYPTSPPAPASTAPGGAPSSAAAAAAAAVVASPSYWAGPIYSRYPTVYPMTSSSLSTPSSDPAAVAKPAAPSVDANPP